MGSKKSNRSSSRVSIKNEKNTVTRSRGSEKDRLWRAESKKAGTEADEEEVNLVSKKVETKNIAEVEN